MTRQGECERETSETSIRVSVDLDGSGATSVSTGLPFFDHMLELMFRHALIDLSLDASGDLEVDGHHTVEDTGLAVGEALSKALGDGLFELRHVGKLNTRVMWFFAKGRRIIAVHGIRNKGWAIPARDLDTAQDRMRDWQERFET